MITGGIQFVHISVYSLHPPKKTSRGADRKWAVRDVLAEASREPQACLHVPRPRPPNLLHGPSLAELEAEIGAIHARSTDAAGRRLRKDASVLLAGVASYPRGGIEYGYWKQCTLEWLQIEFGEHLRTVVEHTDETHPHVHFYVVNPDGGNVKDLHPGFRAAKGAQTPKEQRLAYNSAMRAFQDRFWEHVAGPSGLARLGPGRQRMSRAQWTRLKFGLPAQAALLQRAREITRGTGERDRQLRSFAHKTMLEAQALIKELEAREARVLALEARLGLKPPVPDSNNPDKD
jgi:hypothetical protein